MDVAAEPAVDELEGADFLPAPVAPPGGLQPDDPLGDAGHPMVCVVCVWLMMCMRRA
jgi:hypothetical protein